MGVGGGGVCILRARERNEKSREIETTGRVERGGARARGGWEKGTNEDGRRTTTITLKAVRDTPAMVLIYRPRFPSPRCHGFHGVLVIIRTFRPPSTFASRPPPPSSLPPPSRRFLRHLFPPLLHLRSRRSTRASTRRPPSPSLPLRRYLAASLRASACIPYNRYVTL